MKTYYANIFKDSAGKEFCGDVPLASAQEALGDVMEWAGKFEYICTICSSGHFVFTPEEMSEWKSGIRAEASHYSVVNRFAGRADHA